MSRFIVALFGVIAVMMLVSIGSPTLGYASAASHRPRGCAHLTTVFPTVRKLSAYDLGETVIILFKNNCSSPILLPNEAPWVIEDLVIRQVVYRPSGQPQVVIVPSRQQLSWTWDQRDNSGKQVPGGMYVIKLETIDAGSYASYFDIRWLDGWEGRPCAQLGTDKRVYKLGETVTIFFTNNCPEPITVDDPFPWFVSYDRDSKLIFFARIPTFKILRVQPGQRLQDTWEPKYLNQQDRQFQWAPEGTYTLSLETWDAGKYITSFEIRALGQPSPLPCGGPSQPPCPPPVKGPPHPLPITIFPNEGSTTKRTVGVRAILTNTMETAFVVKAITSTGCEVRRVRPRLPLTLAPFESKAVRVSLRCPRGGAAWTLSAVVE